MDNILSSIQTYGTYLCLLTENIPLKYSQRNKVHLPTGILAHFSHIGSSQVLGGTEISNDLYSGIVMGNEKLENDSQKDQVNVVSSTKSSSIDLSLWNKRLGHVPIMF
ncbi:hypothetical protein H5410_037432 [Solanum commersonii]|uniref:Uncharacterized protein n=1 Tax=Solanum commersonii TaxID=4109 RepID=A0A9J5Y9I8_SOLCO|nr:hypothetical protein H5410_037432 [Solanum commersonii]